MGSVKAKRFKGVHELVLSNVTKPGQWEAAFNKDTRELYVHYGVDTPMLVKICSNKCNGAQS